MSHAVHLVALTAAGSGLVTTAPLTDTYSGAGLLLAMPISSELVKGPAGVTLPVVLTLENVASAYDVQVENKIAALTSMLEPAMIVMMGAGAGSIAAAILMPLIQMNEFVQ